MLTTLAQTVLGLSWSSILPSTPQLDSYPVVALNITNLFDNQAASVHGSGADFDGRGGSYPAHLLPNGSFHHDGLHFHLPNQWGFGPDNVIAEGQVIELPGRASIHALHILYAGDWIDGESGNRFVLTFEDDTTEEVEVSAKNWWTLHWLNVGSIKTPYHFEGSTMNFNLTQIYQWSTPVQSEQRLRSIALPYSRDSGNRLHIFGISLTPALLSPSNNSTKPILVLRSVRSTTKWEAVQNSDGVLQRAQIIEVTIANLLPSSSSNDLSWIKALHEVEIVSPLFRTIRSARFYRLAPSEEVRLEVLAVKEERIKGGVVGEASVEIRNDAGDLVAISRGWSIQTAPDAWESSTSSLSLHETPNWWNNAKFGIFIHWGIYSVPAWAPPYTYAEWYQWWLHNPANQNGAFWQHHLATYGKDVVYDDFIPAFTAAKFNASEWLELFDLAGAKYFVITTKHHDGFSLFDTGKSTHRSSVHLGPRRDLVGELLDTAKHERPHIHRGTYFSMPEWFNPDAGPYGFGSWPGHLAQNPFDSSKLEDYTGRLNVSDYLEDVQLAQMRILARKYETEIMWCDIGGPNKTLEFASEWYNAAARAGRQVTMNNRCGAAPDFDTPEYARFSSIQTHKWETSEGIDPWSYGLNKQTKPEDYRSAAAIIHSIVDITAKNGAYLLNIGPTAEGEIIRPMVDRLLEVGRWLGTAGECIYNTTYWSKGGEEGDLRFTTTTTTFCIIALSKPQSGLVVIERQIPILPGDVVRLLGASGSRSGLEWWKHGRKTIIRIPQSDLDSVSHAWAFKVEYHLGI